MSAADTAMVIALKETVIDYSCTGLSMHPSHHAISRAEIAAAIINGSGTTLTYADLERRSNQGAHLFRSLGFRTGDSMCVMLENDAAFFERFLSDDHVEVGSSGVATKAEIVPFVGSPVCVVKSYAVDKFELTVFDANTALLTYHAAQDTVCHNRVPSPVWVSSLYVRRGGRWLNDLYQHTPADK